MMFIITLLFSFAHAAQDEWLCTEEAGLRRGNVVYACGVGEGGLEVQARERALEAALVEFRTICDQSSECKGRSTLFVPKRLTCRKTMDSPIAGQWWKCYRLVAIELR